MKPSKHVAISLGVSLVFWFWTRHFQATVACFLSGIFIDLDHHLDYWLVKKEIPWNYKKLVEFCTGLTQKPIYLFFHAYEWLTVLWLTIWWLKLDVIWIGLAVGLTSHLVCDQFANPLKPFTYFLTYRIINKFERRKLFDENYRGKVF